MYPASNAFHAAVANGNEQKALLIFSDAVFTDTDISVDRGIEFHEYFNAEEDLAIGQATSSEILFTLFNDARLLNNYAFGDFIATLGVIIGEDTYQQYGPVMVTTGYGTYVSRDEYPFLMRNSVAVEVQPSFVIRSMLAYEGKVWCFSNDGRYAVYEDATGENITSANPVNAFMRNKCLSWDGKGIYFNRNSRILFVYEAGVRQRWEFVPLGIFTAERPKAPDQIQISMTCYDFMQKFEKDMPTANQLGITYPITIGNLYKAMCEYVGVQYATNVFINSTAVIQKEPTDFSTVTMREVLKWIAEAAGSNARFNRDGILELRWLETTDQQYTASGYREFNPYWYETKQVTKLHNRDTQDVSEKTIGSGDEGYLIQDNPLLKGVS